MQQQHRPVLTLDIGGTKIASAVIAPGGELLSRARVATPDSSDETALVDAAERAAREALALSGWIRVKWRRQGSHAPGYQYPEWRRCVFAHVAALRRTPLRTLISERLDMPVRMANDATLAALGEWEFGLCRSVSDLVYVTLSTGIGGGIIAGGRLQEGACGAGGEVGHMTIDVDGPQCACGRRGCWEAFASGTALADRTVRRLEDGAKSIISELSGGDMSNVDAQMVALAARQGDVLAMEMIETTAFYVGVGLGNLINIFNPSVVVIGGGVTKIGESLLAPAMRVARERAYVTAVADVDIRTALLGDDSPLLGAAALVWGLGAG